MEQYKAARLAEPVTLPVTKEPRATPPAEPPKLTSPATANREIAILARMGSLARCQYGLTVPFVVEKLKERNAREAFFEEAAFRAVSRLLRPELAALATVGNLTGWRKSELRSRQWRHVDFAAGWLRLEPEETKNREGRMFPLIPELRTALEAQRVRVETLQKATGQVIPWVFCRDDGAPVGDFKAWTTARTKAGVPGRLFHDFRRTAVRNLIRAGIPCPVQLAGAVAGSASFPPLVGPITFRVGEEEQYWHAGDGGLYENQGIESVMFALLKKLQEKKARRALVIAFESSYPFSVGYRQLSRRSEPFTLFNYDFSRIPSIMEERATVYQLLFFRSLQMEGAFPDDQTVRVVWVRHTDAGGSPTSAICPKAVAMRNHPWPRPRPWWSVWRRSPRGSSWCRSATGSFW